MSTRRDVLGTLAATSLALGAGRAAAQDDRQQMTVLVGAASSMDFTARVIAEQLQASLGRTVIMQARLGAGQRVALGEARRAAPDGRTLVYATSGPFAIYPHIYTKLDYDPDRDFTPIAGISTFDVAISTGPMTGATTLKQLIAWAKAQGDQAVFGSAPGNGSLSHFLGISINLATGLNLGHVPYKDSGSALADVSTGRLPMLITAVSPQVEMHKAGRIRLLAVSGDRRSPLAPDVPTLKEAGIDLSSITRAGLFGPPRLAPEQAARLHAALQPMFGDAAVRDKLAQQGMTLWPATGAELAASLAAQRRHFAALVKASGYVPEAS